MSFAFIWALSKMPSSAKRFLCASRAVSTRARTAEDAQLWLNTAIPVALKKGKPGTDEFRLALRDAIESLKEFVGSQGVFNLSATDHNGVDARSQVMVKVEGGAWKLVK